jgi:hypothetical protein
VSVRDDLAECAQTFLELLAELGEIGVVIYTDGKSIPVLCQSREELRPMLERVLRGLDEDQEPRGTIH